MSANLHIVKANLPAPYPTSLRRSSRVDRPEGKLVPRKRIDEHIHELAAFVMECPYNSGHIPTSCQCFHLLFIWLETEDSANFVERSLIAILIDQVDESLPASLI